MQASLLTLPPHDLQRLNQPLPTHEVLTNANQPQHITKTPAAPMGRWSTERKRSGLLIALSPDPTTLFTVNG